MRRVLIAISILGIFLAVAVSIVGYYLHISTARYHAAFAAQELRSLQTLEAWLATGANPNSVDLAIGLSEDGISRALNGLRGVRAKTKSLDGVVLEVADARVKLQPGYIHLFLSLSAYRDGSASQIVVNASGVLLTERLELSNSQFVASRVHYRIGIQEVSTELNLGLVSFRTLGVVNEVVASHAAKEFSESLRFSMPIHLPSPEHLDFPVVKRLRADHGQFDVQYSLSEPVNLSSLSLRLIPSIPTSNAVWLLVTTDNAGGIETINESDVHQKDDSVPDEQIAAIRSRIATLVQEFPVFDSDVVVYANPSLLHAAVDAFNNLSNDQRRIDIRLLSRQGHIVKNYKNVKIVGKGGYSIAFDTDESMSGSAKIGRLARTWSEGEGLTLSGEMRVIATARLKLHIDPYLGGGFNTTTNVTASTAVPLQVRIDARKVALSSGVTAAVIGPVLECAQFPVRFVDDGALELGVISYETIGRRQSKPQILMSSDMEWTALVKKGEDGPLQFEDDHWIGIRVVPETIVAGTYGYRFFGRLESSISKGPKRRAIGQEDQLRSVRKLWNRAVQTRCPKERPREYLFAGMKFGPNNTIVKGLKAAGATADFSTQTVKVPVEVIKTILTNPKDTVKVLRSELKEWENKGKKAVKKVWDTIKFW